jgi:tol-pal system protein YbgF
MARFSSLLKFTLQRKLVAGAALVFAGIGATLVPAVGQSQSDFLYLQDRIGQLESQVQAIGSSGGGTNGSADTASIVVRLDAIEEQLRNLTGLAEQNAYGLQQLEDRLRRLSEDTEFRFQELGTGAVDRSSLQPPQPINRAPSNQGLNLQPLPPVSSSSATVGSSSIGQPPSALGTLSVGPVNINPIVQPGNYPPNANSGQVALGVPVDARGEYDVAYAFILQRDYDGAETAFTRFLQNYPNNEYSGNAKYWLGETYFARGQYREAADAFLRSYTEHKNGQKAAASLLKLGMSLQQLGQTSAACSSYAELISNYPSSGDVRARAIQEQQGARC